VTLVLLLSACRGGGDTSPESIPPTRETAESGQPTPALVLEQVWTGESIDDQLGSAVGAGGAGRFAGAPGAHSVVELGDTAEAVLTWSSGRLGHAIAVTDDGVVAGAPLHEDGRGALVQADGDLLLTGEPNATLGAWMAVSSGELLASAGSALWRQGELVEATGRVRSGLVVDGEVMTFAAGTADEAGRAVCVADLDGDGQDEVAVGAPGRAEVTVHELVDGALEAREVLTGTTRFGHALACADGRLAIGDPAAYEHAGAVWLWDGVLAELAAGEAEAELGFALAWDGGTLLVGAPGHAGAVGTVRAYGPSG